MTSAEFKSWIDYHEGLFGGFRGWYAKLADDAIATWAEGMRTVSLEAAKQASKEMAFGELAAPHGYSKHLAAVRGRAREIDHDRESQQSHRRTFVDGHQSYRCPDCPDSGLVDIYHPVTVDAVMRGDESATIKTCVCACHCQAGDGKRLVRYDPSLRYRCQVRGGRLLDVPMIRCDHNLPVADQWSAIVDGINTQPAPRLETEFA